jgi:flagellar hook protein FlgE
MVWRSKIHTKIGLGGKVGSIQKNMQQGTHEITNRPLDLALQGEGFFIISK